MQRLSFKITKWLIILAAVLQLALSQIHIGAIKIMFSPQIGFYLFLFILFGLILVFLLTPLKAVNGSSIFKITLTGLAASGSAAYCIFIMWNDYKANAIIKLNDFQTSIILLLIGIAVYILGNLVLIADCLLDLREAKN
jgi:hypothetical protein